jgi:alkylation response protein AidB-like acyl-CoA dehydrogenase
MDFQLTEEQALFKRMVRDFADAKVAPLVEVWEKCFANEMAKEVTDMALQVFGGYGYSKEYPIERMLRDSRGWALAGGTVQIQRINIVSAMLGRRFNQR